MPIDQEIIDRFDLEGPTPLELAWKDTISAEDFAIYSTKLELICVEAKQLLVNIAVSVGIQSQDCGVGIYTASGDMAMGCVGTYLHVVTGQIPVKFILKHYKDNPTVGLRDGDVFFCNEAIYGGIHNLDMLIATPIFYKDELIAWAVVAGHETETGATKPGGYVPDAKSRYEEGLKVPPLKIGEHFQLKDDVMQLFVNMTRDERVMVGDTKAKTACGFKVRERLLELVEQKGVGFVVGLMRRVLESSAEGARRKVAQLNDGVYTCPIFFDVRGSQEGISRIHVTVTKKDDRIVVDLSGTSPPTQSYLNTRPHIIRAVLVGDLAQFLFSDLPASTGVLAPFAIKAPPNTCVNPPLDAAITASTRLTPIVVNAIHVCLAKMAYDSDYRDNIAVPFGPSGRIIAGGTLNQYGDVCSYVSADMPNGAGLGARQDMDGVDVAGFYYSGFADCLDSEHHEVQYPLLYLHRNVGCDQGGFGKYRGGAALSIGLIIHQAKSSFPLIFSPYNSRIPIDLGLFGGYAGGLNPCLQVRSADWPALFASADGRIPYSYHAMLTEQPVPGQYLTSYFLTEVPYENGDYLAVMGPSAGGYGDVLEREPAAVIEDLRMGLTSHWTARNVYKIVYDEATLRVEVEATRAARNGERASRRCRARRYEEFEAEWLRRRPTAEQLRYYGPWPEGVR